MIVPLHRPGAANLFLLAQATAADTAPPPWVRATQWGMGIVGLVLVAYLLGGFTVFLWMKGLCS